MKRSLCWSLLFLSSQADAFRSAVFDPSLKNQTLLWTEQKRFWAEESEAERRRPIWLHAGDSLASGWASQNPLQDLRKIAIDRVPPDPGSFEDLADLLPSAALTWYAGTDLEKGFLGRLERDSGRDWVLLSTALAGARFTPDRGEDGLKPLFEVTPTDRVELVTLSLGGNDLCQDLHPAANADAFQARLRTVKNRFPKAQWIVWDLPDPVAVEALIQRRLLSIENSLERERVAQYCKKSWQELQCPALKGRPEEISKNRDQIRSALEEQFGKLWAWNPDLEGSQFWNYLGRDCFHPGPLSQKLISESLPLQTPRR